MVSVYLAFVARTVAHLKDHGGVRCGFRCHAIVVKRCICVCHCGYICASGSKLVRKFRGLLVCFRLSVARIVVKCFVFFSPPVTFLVIVGAFFVEHSSFLQNEDNSCSRCE